MVLQGRRSLAVKGGLEGHRTFKAAIVPSVLLGSEYLTILDIGQGGQAIVRLGILGGTFDPVHYGHLLLAESCREQVSLNEVWFLPTAVPPHKRGRNLTPVEARIEMLDLAIAGQEAFSVCRYEADQGGINYTADTLSYFHEQAPDRELFFLLGADMLHDLPNWRQPERICRLATLVVVRRPGTPAIDIELLRPVADEEYLQRVRDSQVEMPAIGLSATEIRRRVAAGESIRYHTPRAVEKYIEAEGLYREDADNTPSSV